MIVYMNIHHFVSQFQSDRHLHGYLGVRLVILYLDVLILEPVDARDAGVDFQLGEGERGQPVDLLQRLNVVTVHMHVTHCMHKLARFQARHLGQQAGQQGIAGDIKRDPQTHITASLVHQAIKPAIAGDMELAQQVARRQCHLAELAGVPG